MLPAYNTQLVLYYTYLQSSIYIGRPLPVYSIHPTCTTYTCFIARLYTTHCIVYLYTICVYTPCKLPRVPIHSPYTPDSLSTGHQPPTAAQTLPMYCCRWDPGYREGTIWLGGGGCGDPCSSAHIYIYIYIIIFIYIYLHI